MVTDPTTIPSVADLQKTKKYMDNIDDFVSSGNDTLTDADGVNRKTLTGIENDADTVINNIQSDADTVINNIQSDADSTLAEKSDEFDQVIDQYKESRGFRNKGTFSAGFTYEKPNDVGFDGGGQAWALTDVNSLPHTVTAGTTPSEPTFYQASYSSAAQVSTNTSDTVQSFVDSFALKIFQSPTDGGLTEIQTRTVNAGEMYEVRKTSDGSLATIYSDATGTTEIVQDGTGNKSGSDGVVRFYIADGEYYVEVNSVKSSFNVSRRFRYDNVDEMVSSTNISLGQIVETLGYTEAFDNGGCEYKIVTASSGVADGGSFIALNNGLLAQAQFKNNIVKLSQFGGNVRESHDAMLAYAIPLGLNIDYEDHGNLLIYTPYIIGLESDFYSGEIYGNLNLTCVDVYPAGQDGLIIRNLNRAKFYGDILVNGRWACRDSISMSGVGAAKFHGSVHGRRGSRWGVAVTSVGNNNSIVFGGELRATISGTVTDMSFTETSRKSNYSTLNVPDIDDDLEVHSIFYIAGEVYTVNSISNGEVVVAPALSPDALLEPTLKHVYGGGFCTWGSDSGVANIKKMVVQANRAIGYRSGSLYGQFIGSFVGELNDFADIAFGLSSPAANLKNTFSDIYLEGNQRYQILILSSTVEVNSLNTFNLRDDGLYSYELSDNSTVNFDFSYFYNIPTTEYSSASTDVTVHENETRYFKTKPTATTNVDVTLKNRSYVNGVIVFIVEGGSARTFTFSDFDGNLINGQSSILNPAEDSFKVTFYKQKDDNWVAFKESLTRL